MPDSLRDEIKKILMDIELESDGACGDPECCGSPTYDICEKSASEALDAILSAIKKRLPVNNEDNHWQEFNDGYNLCLKQVTDILDAK